MGRLAPGSAWILLATLVLPAGDSLRSRAQQATSQASAEAPKTKSQAASGSARRSAANAKLSARSEYAGDTACAGCHQDIFDAYEKTAHHLTSQVANKNTIVGDFNPGSNTMATANPNLSFRMDVRGDEFLQTAIWSAPTTALNDAPTGTSSSQEAGMRSRTERLDLVIGSGGKGQTYLYWKGDELFQLPVGYSTVLHEWINSPGYVDGTANFERPVIPRCLECHTTYFDAVLPGSDFNVYNKDNFVLGISCERCHGPGRRHIESQRTASAARSPAAIVNPAKLSPARRADICAQCHGGQGEREILPAFSYVPGQPLGKYIDLGTMDSAADVDVHGQQGKLLMKSRCFQASANMTCSTCHNVHKKEPDLAAMSQHCLSCHELKASPRHAKAGDAISKNCIDCHMPTLPSKVVYLDVHGQRIRPTFRTHWIKIYSDAEGQQAN